MICRSLTGIEARSTEFEKAKPFETKVIENKPRGEGYRVMGHPASAPGATKRGFTICMINLEASGYLAVTVSTFGARAQFYARMCAIRRDCNPATVVEIVDSCAFR